MARDHSHHNHSNRSHKKHKARLHYWIDGLLHTIEHPFMEFESALARAIESACFSFKILDEDGFVVCYSDDGLTVNNDSPY